VTSGRILDQHKRPKSGDGLVQTSQLSRMKHKAPAADLSGGKTSADSFIPRRINLAPEDTRDIRSDLLLDVDLGSTVSSEEFVRFLFPVPVSTDRTKLGVVLRSGFRKGLLDVGKVERPVPRSVDDPAGCTGTESTFVGSSSGAIFPPDSFPTRPRCFERGMNFRMPQSKIVEMVAM
jgi:hypothetical protein